MSKKKGHGPGHIDETWLIPYADLLTLLLALFIVLFCSSSVDKEKYEKIMRAFASEFKISETSQGGGGGNFLPDDLEGLLTLPHDDGEDDGGSGSGNGDMFGEESQIGKLYGALFDYIEGNNLGEEMQVQITGESLLITLTSDIWFPSGSAAISSVQSETARKMTDMIASIHRAEDPLQIVITGHTDNVPIGTAQYRSNWHLSVIRAVNFMEVMLEGGQLNPRMFSARGYGEYEPIDTNDTSEGRQRNRRVEVLISIDNPNADKE